MSLRHYLCYRAFDVEARIAVNDVPVFMHAKPSSVQGTLPINAWLGDEPSEIRIEVSGPLDGSAPAGALAVSLVARGAEGGDKTLLATNCPLDATQEEMIVRGKTWTMRRVLRLDGLSRPPSDVWPAARAVILTDQDRVAIHELVMSIQKAFDEGDAEVLERELSLQQAEMARSEHCSVADIRRALAAMLGVALRGEPADELVDVESEEGLSHLDETMELHLVSRDRLVWVTRDAFSPALRIPATGPGLHIPVYVAKRNDRWVVVR